MAKTERLERDLSNKTTINKTDLKTFQSAGRGIIHRDMISHALRWNHILKWMSKLRKNENFSILDLGCGSEFPFLRTLYTNKVKPHYYLGCDVRNLNLDEFHQIMNPNFEHEFQKIDFISEIPKPKYEKWDAVVFLEVLEHVSKENGIKILENIKSIMNSDTTLFISTPAYNGKAASNHVYEWEYQELKDQLESMFSVEASYGTFASQKDIEPAMSECEKEV